MTTTRALSSTIPAEGVKFRLKARETKKVIYSRPENEPLVWHHPGNDLDDNQIFTLIYGKNDRDGQYAIKSWYCGKLLFSRRTEDPHVGNVYGEGTNPDNWFNFIVDKSDKNSFRIHSSASDSVIYSRINGEPQFGNFVGTHAEDQLWHFLLVESDD